ncbi:hypothetical protein QE417_000217 [Mucilaginibacter terrae]|uniref:Outer membrane protein beta-barrel domain-containing protein n=1 Tax=Mucilaginibacter terrae TaxID=1955052 RepID=A0ABU3GMX6_9SPHI|nr:hypothetical protein [Mucilaginibacter terrae]
MILSAQLRMNYFVSSRDKVTVQLNMALKTAFFDGRNF